MKGRTTYLYEFLSGDVLFERKFMILVTRANQELN